MWTTEVQIITLSIIIAVIALIVAVLVLGMVKGKKSQRRIVGNNTTGPVD